MFFAEKWAKFLNNNTRIFGPNDLDSYARYKAVDFVALEARLEDILKQNKDGTVNWIHGIISKHIITEERQMTQILAEVMKNKFHKINPRSLLQLKKCL